MGLSIIGRAASLYAVFGTGIAVAYNVSSVSNPIVGSYVVTLTLPGQQAIGVVTVNCSDPEAIPSGTFTGAAEITVTFRRTDGSLLNPSNGSIIMLSAEFGLVT